MTSISKSIKFVAFCSAVLMTNFALVQLAPAQWIGQTGFQYQPAPQAVYGYGNQTFIQPTQQWGVVPAAATIGTTGYYSAGYQPAYSSPVEVLPAVYSQASVPVLPQQSFYSQGYGGSPIPVIHSKDVGYLGPGDMRTHLWKHHASDLQANGISQASLMSMPMAKVQTWHNYFHGTEGAPDDH